MGIQQSLVDIDLGDLDYEYNIPSGTRDILIGISAQHTGRWRERGALVSYEFTDVEGNVALPNSDYLRSPAAGLFFYLDLQMEADNPSQPTVEVVSVPAGAVTLRLNGKNWLSGMRSQVHELWIVALDGAGLTAESAELIPEWLESGTPTSNKLLWTQRHRDRGPVEPGNDRDRQLWSIDKEIVGAPRAMDANRQAYRPHRAKPANRYKVALICDEFTYNSFAPEFEHAILEPDNWREVLEEFQPDFFLCESTWSGVDSRRRPWRGQIYASARFPRENRGKLLEILAYCREKSIPTVFWNKEDPTHFHDRVNDFVSTASKFDYVLTTAEEVVDEYAKFMPAERVGVLQFGVQPRDFNPLSGTERTDRAVFAGAWYDVHPERSETMRRGFDWVLDGGVGLDIFDRNLTSSRAETTFPEPYAQFVNPAVSHKATARLYRSSAVGLNFNTVVDSKTMFARRVFEIAASGSLVVSNYSPGIERIYGDSVLYYDRMNSRLGDLGAEERQRCVSSALRKTLLGHTYRHRFESILKHIGLPFTSSRPAPTMMVEVSSEVEVQDAVNTFHALSREYSRLLIVISDTVASSRSGRFVTDFSSANIDVISKELIATEKVPSTNYLSTPDVIWAAPRVAPSGRALESLLMHGEYSRLPTRLSDRNRYGMSAGVTGPGSRLAAIDVNSALLEPTSTRPNLEVAP